MSLPELIELSRADFVAIDTIGPPGKRTFYLQAAQDDLLITMVIEKEHAAALSIAIQGMLEHLGGIESHSPLPITPLVHPVDPLFRAGQLGLGYDKDADMIVILIEELTPEEQQPSTTVHIWANRVQMAALAHQASIAVASGRPTCPLCQEPIEPDEEHVCIRDNGRKRLYETNGE
ncbi:MAG TPA: DUF3090 family protein [Chloroflexi bacterium]|nr:DUF3090 family protein [Chloroflexota bacterium]